MQNLQVQTWEHRVLWLLKTVLEGVLGELALIKINKKGSDKFPKMVVIRLNKARC